MSADYVMRTRTTLTVVAFLTLNCMSTGSRALQPPVASNSSYAFEQGFPSKEASQHARDDADYQRALIAYRLWYPTVSTEGVFNGNRQNGIQDNVALALLSAGPRHVAFTANSDTPYGCGVIDVKDGPMVVELPAGSFIGTANDHHQRWIMDMGLPGPDAGRGGKHLIVPPNYKQSPPAGYHVGRSPSFKVFLAMRVLPADGDVKKAMDKLRTIKIYPLNTASKPKPLSYVDITDKRRFDATCLQWEDNLQFWEVLQRVIDTEPLVNEFRPMYGLLYALGIAKDKPFAPDPRMTSILERAARNGRDQMLVSAFNSSRPDRITWTNRQWEWVGLVSNNGSFETPSGIDLEARDRWFAQAILVSPAMFARHPGAGSLYWLGLRDDNGSYLDGSKSYKLTVPLPVPGKLFWSVTVYDAATRSEIQTDQDKAALRSLFELKSVAGQSVDLYFGPAPPARQGAQWIKTIPGKGWFAYFRIYSPEQPAFDGSWKPGDFELEPGQQPLPPTGSPLGRPGRPAQPDTDSP